MDADRAPTVVSPVASPAGLPVKGAGRINVLFLLIQMAMGGSERLVLNLVRHIDRRRFAPSVGWFMQSEPLREFEDLEVPLYHIPKTRRFDWGTMQTLRTLVRREQIDVINAHHFMSFFYACYAAHAAARTGLIYTEHSEADVLNVTGKWRMAGRWLLRSSDAAVGVSEPVSRALASHFHLKREKVHTIPNGVDLDLFTEATASRARLREQLGLAPDQTIIGTVANFRRNKNHLFLVKAFHGLARQRRDVTLLIVGQGFPGDPENSEREVRAYIHDHALSERVLLMGYRPDVQELLQVMDVFCLVSHKEGLPLSLIEAMASGLPAVGSDIDGIRRLIQPELNGLLVAPDNSTALRMALNRLVVNPALRRRMGAASTRLAREQYSLSRCVDETQRLFMATFESLTKARGIS